MSIPKVIHYCWFGGNPLPPLVQKCINSWQEYCPDYKIIKWDEDNFDVNSNKYVKQAYEAKKYAFVSDYVRLYALYNYGGIYMDADVEVVKSLDDFLNHRAFTGCENNDMCVTGTMGAEKNNIWICKLLDWYRDKNFILKNGRLDTTPNTHVITQITTKEYNWIPENKYQILEDELHIYPFDFLCAKDWRTGKVMVTKNTYTIHHFSASWVSEKDKKRSKRKQKIKDIIVKIIGKNGFIRLKKVRDKIVNNK